jgi:FkbM family methyltransferase
MTSFKMGETVQPASCAHQEIGTMEFRARPVDVVQQVVNVAGKDCTLAYPNSGNAEKHINNILAGTDYPLPAPTDWWSFTPDVIIDIGANVGAASFCFADRYPGVPIYCYEPAKGNVEYLSRNVEQLGCATVMPFGLHKEDREVPLYHGNKQCLQHSIVESPEVNSCDYEMITLRDALAELSDKVHGRCLLKMDTEGCEVAILERIAPLLQHVDMLYLEYHHENDRRRIDALLPSFSVLFSKAPFLHRGNVLYGSERLVRENPQMDEWGLLSSLKTR